MKCQRYQISCRAPIGSLKGGRLFSLVRILQNDNNNPWKFYAQIHFLPFYQSANRQDSFNVGRKWRTLQFNIAPCSSSLGFSFFGHSGAVRSCALRTSLMVMYLPIFIKLQVNWLFGKENSVIRMKNEWSSESTSSMDPRPSTCYSIVSFIPKSK